MSHIKIVPTEIENADNNQIDGDKSFNTNDLIYIKSFNEVELGASSMDDLICYPTDYAVMNGVIMGREEKGWQVRKACGYWTRCPYSNMTMFCVDHDGEWRCDFVNVENIVIRPTLNVEISNEDILTNRYNVRAEPGVDKIMYHTLEFGHYPSRYVGDLMNLCLEDSFIKGTVKPTGKKYLGRIDGDKYIYHDEYILEHEKYVRISDPKFVDEHSELFDGPISRDYDNYWVKVEPIRWIINNWDELPEHFDDLSKTHVFNLTAEEGLVVLPFYSNDKDKNLTLWQNSTIRGYLNGYDVNNIKSNGYPKYSAPNGGNFSEHSFLTEAFDEELHIISKQENIKDVVEHVKKKRKGYGVEIVNKKMTINEQIKFYIDNGKSFMLHGPSGIGKTRRIEEIDEEFVPIVLRNGILPEEVIGKTIYPNNDKTNGGIWSPPAWYVDLCEKCEREPDKQHVLFIDEITNVKPSEQSLVFHLVLNNSIGPNIGKLPDNVVVVAAGNSKEESESAYNMPEPLFRRFEGHIYLKPDIQQWIEWGSEEDPNREGCPKVHPIVSSFVGTFGKDVFYSKYDSEEPPKYAVDPRGWEQVSDIIYDNDCVVVKELISNKVGDKIADKFMEFVKKPLLMLDDVLEENYSDEDIPETFNARYVLMLQLRNVNMESVEKVRDFIHKYLGETLLETYDELWIGEDKDRARYIDKLKRQKAYEYILAKKKRDDPGIFQEEPKISIYDFYHEFNEGKVGIRCRYKEEADILCECFDSMGKTWKDGASYLDNSNWSWSLFGRETVYTNDGQCWSLNYAEEASIRVFEFDEVDLMKKVFYSKSEMSRIKKLIDIEKNLLGDVFSIDKTYYGEDYGEDEEDLPF